MAKSFYKYADRDTSKTQVDFNELSSAFDTKADALVTDRTAKKAALEENYQLLQKKIDDDSPLGGHAGANEAMAKFSQSASQKALNIKKLMESGDLSISERNSYMTNLQTSTTQMFELGDTFNTNREELLLRHQEGGIGSKEELAYLEQAELFNGQGEPFIGENGQVYLSARDADTGLLGNNPMSLAKAKAMMTQRVDKFDLGKSSGTSADALGVSYTEAVRAGKIKTVDDARNNPAFSKALDTFVSKDLSTDSAAMSVILDGGLVASNDLPYEYSLDPSEKGANIIHGEYNEVTGVWTPKLTPSQKTLSEDTYRNSILAQIGRKETAIEKTQEWELNRGDDRKEGQKSVGMAGKLYNGSEDEIQAAREYFLGLDPKLKTITRTIDGVVVTHLTDDGTTATNTISLKTPSGKMKTQADFIRSLTELTGEADVEDALKRGNYTGTTPTSHSSILGAERTQSKNFDADEEIGTLEIDVKGSESLMDVDSAFALIDINDGIGQNEERGAAKKMAAIGNQIFNNLSGGRNDGLMYGPTDEDASVFQIELPGTMTAPIFMKVNSYDDLTPTKIKNVTKAIYTAAARGDKIAPSELRDIIGEDNYNDMEAMYDAAGIDFSIWNAGDGTRTGNQQSSGQSTTVLNPNGTGSQFN
tara:strand:- start:2588 stop:4528 length:1941 start_codon:yes stop_codon:yes gene_type:complete